MTQIEPIVRYSQRIGFRDLSPVARHKLKTHILDTIGCALGALDLPLIKAIRLDEEEGTRSGPCTLIGGGSGSVERAAFFNTALVRCSEWSDVYFAPGRSCHPSGTFGSLLACTELMDSNGRDLLTALAIACHVQCRLAAADSSETYLPISLAAGVSRSLRLSRPEAINAVRSAAREEGGGGEAQIDWHLEGCEAIIACSLRRFPGHEYAQSTIEAMLELRRTYAINASDVHAVRVGIFRPAFDTVGAGGLVRTAQQAARSLPYLVSAALLDGEVGAEQLAPSRIRKRDIQDLMGRVRVQSMRSYTRRYPEEMPCHVELTMRNGSLLRHEKADYRGHYLRPLSWEQVISKFERLAGGVMSPESMRRIQTAVAGLEYIQVRDLTALLKNAESLSIS